MSKNEITKVRPPQELALPDYIRQETELGIEDLKDFVVPPRMKVVQKQSDARLLEQFSAGDIIIVPNMQAVAALERDAKGRPSGDPIPFKFTPLFFFPEWCTWNPLEMKAHLPSIRERSFDPKSIIAMKARDQEKRIESCPENAQYKIRHTEHMNFLIMLTDHELSGQPIVMSFSRAEHAAGRRLASLIKMRKAPIYSCIFEGRAAPRSNNMGDWWGIDATNPSVDTVPWVSKEEFDVYKAAHQEFKKLHEEAKLRVDYEATGDEEVVTTTSTEY